MTVVGTIVPEGFAYRELQAVREIAHAFLVADRPEEVHQFALDRVTPLLGASFSLVLLLDASKEFMHPVAQHQWPERYSAWIGALRVRVGQGPSGLAVAEERVVEVADLHADPLLADWFDVATELGFRSIVAAPLMGSRGALGAIAFYFADDRQVTAEQRDLVRLIADQLAATSEKALLIAELRRANAALAEANSALEVQARQQDETQAREYTFFGNFSTAVMHVASTRDAPEIALGRIHSLAAAARQTAALERGAVTPVLRDVDPRAPLLSAVAAWRPRARPLPITVGEPTVLLPTMRSDERLLAHALHLALGYAVHEACRAGTELHADVELGRGFVAYRLQWNALVRAEWEGQAELGAAPPEGMTAPFDPFQALAAAVAGYDATGHAGDDSEAEASELPAALTSPLDLPLVRSLARLLGGDVRRTVDLLGELAIESLSLIFPLDATPDTGAAMTRLSAPWAH